jgi:hypothetical protein
MILQTRPSPVEAENHSRSDCALGVESRKIEFEFELDFRDTTAHFAGTLSRTHFRGHTSELLRGGNTFDLGRAWQLLATLQ